MLQEIANRERKIQLLIRGMTEGVLSERDRLLQYTIGEFYQELSLFIEECDKKKKYLDSLKNK